jgi:hypothetical protein
MISDKQGAMRNLVLIVCMLLFIAGCKKDGYDPEKYKPGIAKLTLVKGNNQSGQFGELLSDTIKLSFTSNKPDDHFKISVAYIQGNGIVESYGDYPFLGYYKDTAGTIILRWRMGCDNQQQKVRFYIHTDNPRNQLRFDGAPTDSITVSASAVKPSGWIRACGYGQANRFENKIITPDNSTLYLVNSGLFKSTDGGLNWYKVNGIPYSDEIVYAQFNSNDWLYVLTSKHGIFYTKDMLQWTAINNGILDMRYPTAFLVEDTALWANFDFDGTYRTTNNGEFWRKLVIFHSTGRVRFLRRHPSGTIVLVNDWNEMKASNNNGDTWDATSFTTNFPYHQIHDMAFSPQGVIYVGGGDATISEYDPATGNGSVHRYYEWNASSQHIDNITITPTDVYYLVNHTPSPGIYRKSNNWGKVDIGFNERINYYYLKNNGNFVIGSDKWLFYKD